MKNSDRLYWQQYILDRIKVNKKTGCWEWQLSLGTWGYGQGNGHMYGLDTAAHRLAYKAFKGPIPKGMLVRHKCHNPPCCNPVHLRIGTKLDNVADNRRSGLRTGNDKLTHKHVRDIRHLLATGYYTQTQLSRVYGVSIAAINSIALGKAWTKLKG